MVKKILLFGPPEAGKTTLRRFIFEGIPPGKLVDEPELPTIGMSYNRYGYVHYYPFYKPGKNPEKVPLNLIVFDSSGQEINRWLNESKESVFEETDLLLFIFDISEWMVPDKRANIKDLWLKVSEVRNDLSPDSRFCILGHKIDLLGQKYSGKSNQKKLAEKIKNELKNAFSEGGNGTIEFEMYLTSIFKHYLNETFYTILAIIMDEISPL
ncbi:MAG: hypothetical protein ACFFCS_10140 [Candidatus Hodarchaeota archaeon]